MLFTGYMALSKDTHQPRAFNGKGYVFATPTAVRRALKKYCRLYECDLEEEFANTIIVKAEVKYDTNEVTD